jgi:mRNA interferase RelE/StbE
MASVKVTPEALEHLANLPRVARERIGKLLQRLERWPAVSGVKPLSGKLVGWYRMRTGDYRIRFHVKGQNVIVDKVGHRKDIYED